MAAPATPWPDLRQHGRKWQFALRALPSSILGRAVGAQWRPTGEREVDVRGIAMVSARVDFVARGAQ